jgi:hypothetical protein
VPPFLVFFARRFLVGLRFFHHAIHYLIYRIADLSHGRPALFGFGGELPIKINAERSFVH